MKVSARANYACLAMLELASRQESGNLARIREIAGRHHVPPRFLVKILLQLKRAGLVSSTRGSSGGYRMNKAPDEVSLGDVLKAVNGPTDETSIVDGGQKPSPAAKVLSETWQGLAAAEQEMLRGISLADLLDRVRRHDGQMYYI